MNAIVLCGGLGTRLGFLTKQTPKPLLDVAGRPFICYVLDNLTQAGITNLVLAAGFQWLKIRDCIGNNWNGIPVHYSLESEPLGTGGAIKQALMAFTMKEALIVNGDTLFDINITKFLENAIDTNAMSYIALRKDEDCSRYGRVTVNAKGRILSFGEKGHKGEGLINGGIYYLQSRALESFFIRPFSFENDYLQKNYSYGQIFGMPFDDYFIDIGIPFDLERAQTELMILKK